MVKYTGAANVVIVIFFVVMLFIGGCSKKVEEPICGNNLVEEGETSETCCEDVGCPENQICQNNVCQEPNCGECQYLKDNECLDYECCSDSECEINETCSDNNCIISVTEPLCGECQYLENNKCVDYKCCPGESCGRGGGGGSSDSGIGSVGGVLEDVFGIYTSTLDGKNIEQLNINTWQDLTHARVSPNHEFVTFSTYNNIGNNNCAEESPTNYNVTGANYLETEVMLMRTDGTGIKTLIPPNQSEANVNSYWVNDTELIYLNFNSSVAKINRVILDENMTVLNIEKLPIPDVIQPTDPHQVGNLITFPGSSVDGSRAIWVMNSNGSNLRQLTFPSNPLGGVLDADPKISPDGTKIAFMRSAKNLYSWHVFIVDVATGVEVDLSQGNINDTCEADAMPGWSSDGELLIIWHPKTCGGQNSSSLYTINHSINERKKIPLPGEYFYKEPSFFPGNGSSNESRIIFSTRKIGVECNITTKAAPGTSTLYGVLKVLLAIILLWIILNRLRLLINRHRKR